MGEELREEIRSDIHGLQLNQTRKCDYCGEDINTRSPVQCEVARLGEMPNLRGIILTTDLPHPTGWTTDSLRCQECEIGSVYLPTDGFDEALVTFEIADTTEQVAVDATDLSVVDASKDGSGYHPPTINLQILLEAKDIFLVRWSRINGILKLQDRSTDEADEGMNKLKDAVASGKEVPPEVATKL